MCLCHKTNIKLFLLIDIIHLFCYFKNCFKAVLPAQSDLRPPHCVRFWYCTSLVVYFAFSSISLYKATVHLLFLRFFLAFFHPERVRESHSRSSTTSLPTKAASHHGRMANLINHLRGTEPTKSTRGKGQPHVPRRSAIQTPERIC